MRGLTRGLTGVGEDDDVIEGPRVVGMRWVEGQLGCPFGPQGQQEGGVHHGDPEAAAALAVLGGEVLSCAAIVALEWFGRPGRQGSPWSPGPSVPLPTAGRTCGVIPHQKLE